MTRAIFKIALALIILCYAPHVFALRNIGNVGTGGGIAHGQSGAETFQSRVAACARATTYRNLELNNVRARIETGGSMWQDRNAGANGMAAYEIPKTQSDEDESVSSLYAGALWLGGLSPDQQLKLAAVTFRTNDDFWTGPLTNDGTAEVTESTCEFYDQFFVSWRADAQRHRQWFDMIAVGASQAEIDAAFPLGYTIPGYFFDFPAHGNVAAGQDYYLGPYYDYPSSNPEVYDPENGDYPWYDFLRDVDCARRQREDVIPLFGDQTFYWIFNDKGNIHTESQGQPIGMEIRAQAFAFTSNNEINNMTFLNYVLINQGTQTLTNTYMGSWVDSDLGNANDDLVGCDVKRGLGYCYNGDNDDQPVASSLGYGANPPAVGVDFFEGPYQDEDGMDNPLTTNIIDAEDSLGIPYKGLGIGYRDSIIDNERFGMRKFVYYNIGGGVNGDPSTAVHFYNYLRGIWTNGATMLCGGNGLSNGGGIPGLECDYMFPGDSDPYNWGSEGASYPLWTEEDAGNPPGDRRFIQSAGPFTLFPGDYNNITIGVVWARTTDGGPLASVELLREADDKAQALFDNCFEIVSGPDAPDVAVQELNKEIILMLSNENSISNNFKEQYLGFDPGIPEVIDAVTLTQRERSYTFQGYLVYQIANAQVSNSELGDIDKARLIAQSDVIDGVANIINYYRDPVMELTVPTLMVEGSETGLVRSVRITEDAFATGNSALINHKTYYFMAIAYGYNNYMDYSIAEERGQDESYIASRKAAVGDVPIISAIPHDIAPEAGGTISNSTYGDGVILTRIEGMGNGTNELTLTAASEAEILANNFAQELHYLPRAGQVDIKVVDPLRVQAIDFELALMDTSSDMGNPDSMRWELRDLTNNKKYNTYHSFQMASEDVLINYGISINWGQYEYFNDIGDKVKSFTALLSDTKEYSDPSQPWLAGISDIDGFSDRNWIRSGSQLGAADAPIEDLLYNDFADASSTQVDPSSDKDEIYEGVIGGTWSPYSLASWSEQVTPVWATGPLWFNSAAPLTKTMRGDVSGPGDNINSISGLNNVDVVFTSDKSKWTRCPVLEMQPNALLVTNLYPDGYVANKMMLRAQRSVDKNGKNQDQQGFNQEEGLLTGDFGMGWFPGYAIDLGTGERLNLAFGEDSWLVGDNGRDMIWNPSPNISSENIGAQTHFGGQHWIFVFKNASFEKNEVIEDKNDEYAYINRYDSGAFQFRILSDPGNFGDASMKKLFRGCTWIGSARSVADHPMLSVEQGLIPTETRIRLRVAKPYLPYSTTIADLELLDGNNQPQSRNNWNNLYSFSTKGLEAITVDANTLTSALDIINIVPNPYYAFSAYETNKLDNRVKITNVPEVCTISIYDLNGTLIRQFKKADPKTSIDWDLKNASNIPIASGTYIIHVVVPDIGEKILKWFGVMRPIDLDNF